jgi:tetratricopeptide (TPR) repeat protein
MGRNYSLSNQIEEAAECYIKADRLQIDDSVLRGRINSNMAYICAQSNNDSLALIFYNRAGRDFKKSGNEWRYAQNLLSVSECYVYLHQFATADSILKLAHTYALDSAYCERLMHIQGKYFYEKQEYDSALICLKRCEEYLSTNMDKSYLYIDIMRVYIKKNMVVHALPYALFIIENSTNPNLLKNAYYCLELVAEARNNTILLSYYAHARNDIGKILYDEISKYDSATSVLGNYLLNPHPLRWVWILLALMIAMCGVLIAGILIYRKRTKLQLHMSNEHIVELSTQLEKQENELNIACQKNHQTKMIDEIRIKYPTPPNKWNDYCRLKTDINPYLSTWLTALEELNLTNREKVLCTFIFLYPYLSVEELAKFMCVTKGGVQVIKSHIVKKIGVDSNNLVDYLQEKSKE